MELYISLLGIFVLLLFSAVKGINIVYPLAVGLVVFIVLTRRKGFSMKSILSMLKKGAAKTNKVYILLILVGTSTALWMACGTVPFFIYYGISFMNPKLFVLSVFLITCMIASLIGSLFGTVGTIGIIFVIMAKAGNINPYLVAGAIISAAHFGERSTPLSTSLNLLTAVTESNIYENIKNMFKSAILPLTATVLLYSFFSLRNPLQVNFTSTGSEILKLYNINWIVALPAIVILVFVALKLDVRAALLASIITAFAEGILIQHRPAAELICFILRGFALDPSSPLAAIIHGGGLLAMVKSILIIAISSAIAGIFEGAGLLSDFEKLIAQVSTKAGLFPTTLLTSIIGVFFGCSQTFSVIFTSQFMKKLYRDKGKRNSDLALDVGNTSIVVAALVPWSISATFPAAVLGIGTGFAPYAFYLYLIPLFVLFQKASKALLTAKNPVVCEDRSS